MSAYIIIMKSNVQILSLKENKITYKIKKHVHIRMLSICMFFVVCVVMLLSVGGNNVRQVASNMVYIFDPVNSLYNDNSSIIFASVTSRMKDTLDFVIPNTSSNVEVDINGNILIEVTNSIMVKSIESGVVEEIGITNDGVKYIKVLHCIGMSSVIENLDVIGVVEGECVKRGQDIATAKLSSVITTKIFEDDTQVSNIKINQSKIICQK